MPANGGLQADDTMFNVREHPWHNHPNTVVVDEQLKSAEALKVAGLDWHVDKMPFFIQTNEGYIEVPDHFATVRDIDHKVLGSVRRDYVPFQNKDGFEFGDFIVDSGEGHWQSAGSLRGGKWVWMMLELKRQILIAGEDPVGLFLLVFTSHDGSKKITAAVTPQVVVCENTLNLALGTARQLWGIRHDVSAKAKIQDARDSLKLTFKYADEFERIGNELATAKFSEKDFTSFVEKLLAPSHQSDDRKQEMSAHLLTLFKESPNVTDSVRKTKWGALNVVGEYVDWTRKPRTPEAQLLGSWIGNGKSLRNRALELLTA